MPIVQTVLGSIDPIHLGRTLTHEHVAQDFDGFCSPAPKEFKPFLEQKVCMENLGYVRQYPYSSVDNGRFYGEDCRRAILKDVVLYKKFGGGTIVENSVHGVKRNLDFMVEVAESTGVHMIAGTGHYVHEFQEPATINITVEQMGELYSKEIMTGVKIENGKVVKCGFIGEVGSGYPIHDFEKRAIQATGEIQETLGCGVSFHPGRNPQAPFEVMRLYLEAGGKANKCVMSHLDRTIFDMDELLEFSKLGCYLQYDLFGLECSFYQFDMSTDMPSDAQRINNLMKLMEEGLANRILMSHDIYTKHRLTSYGGHGYHHIHMNVLPRMLAKGVTVEQIEQITMKNPANWLEFNI